MANDLPPTPQIPLDDLTPTAQMDLTPAPQIAFIGEWTFINLTVPPPANAQVRLNDGGQNKATLIYVNNITFNGIDAKDWLMEMIPGCVIRFDTKNDATRWQSYTIVGEPIQRTGYVELKVTWLAGGANLAQTNLLASFVSVVVRASGSAATTSTGSTAVSLPKVVPVTGVEIGTSAGDVSVKGHEHVIVHVTSPAMQAQPGSVEISGYIALPDSAFPSDTPLGYSSGMTLRQWYAGQAVMGWVAAAGGIPAGNLVGKIADFSFKVADSMIAFEKREAAGIIPPLVGQPKPLTPPRRVA